MMALLPSSLSAKTLAEYEAEHIHLCGNQYSYQKPPMIIGNKDFDLYFLCFEAFAVGYSGHSKTALWSAEHLTSNQILVANKLKRYDSFHEEQQLPDSVKTYLVDYQHTPYDRGHLAPNADMATLTAQYEI